MGKKKNCGFTLVELLVVVAIISLLVSIMLPALARSKEIARRAACGANLAGIEKAMSVYGSENNNRLPTVMPAGINDYVNAAQGTPVSTDPQVVISAYYGTPPLQAGDTMACMWVLVLDRLVSPKEFVCPSDPASPTPADFVTGAMYNNNFGNVGGNNTFSDKTYSYSVAYPWAYTHGATYPVVYSTQVGDWWKSGGDSGLPLLADMAPWNGTGNPAKNPAAPRIGTNPHIYNSNNHSGGEGQNVAFADTHVEFTSSPYIGQGGDNIWTIGQQGSQVTWDPSWTPILSPAGPPYDILMVPVRDAGTNHL